MYANILISSTILSICYGSPLNHAISSVTFIRKDIPLSYNYSHLHIYETEPPNKDYSPSVNRSRRLPQPLNFENFQYAPLDLYSTSQQTEKTTELFTTEKIVNSENKYEVKPYKENERRNDIEPKVQDRHQDNSNVTKKTIVFGHNIEVQPKINNYRNPFRGLHYNNNNNVNEQIFQNMHQVNADEEIKYVKEKPFSRSTILEAIETYRVPHLDAKNNLIDENFFKEPREPNKRYEVLQLNQNGELQHALSSFVKTPRIHINVARSYNLAQSPVKTLTNVIQNIPNKKQTLLLQGTRGPLEYKTILHPLHYSNNNYVIRRLGT